MSGRQLQQCAARLPERERGEFLALMRAAAVLWTQGAELRRRAWRLYRGALGVERRDPKP